MRIFEHNFSDNKEKGRRHTVVCQVLLTQLAGKFSKKTCAAKILNRFLVKINHQIKKISNDRLLQLSVVYCVGEFMTEIYRIAEKNIEITSIHSGVHNYCKQYKATGTPDFKVETTRADIEFEREKSARENILEGIAVRNYSDSYLEELAVYRKIALKMLDYDTFLFHGSVVSVDGEAYLFTAKSGTGKSTHTRLWRELLEDKAVMVNDDKPLIKVTNDSVTVFGTPYNGKHRLGNNISVPLKAICILERAKENTIHSVTGKEAYPMLLQQVYRPNDSEKLLKTLSLIDLMTKNIKLYKLGCNMDISAAEVAYNGMKNSNC